MTNHIPDDLSHLSDAEFHSLCPQGEHAPGPQPLSPAAQAVLDALIDGRAEAAVGPQKRITWWNDRVGVAAALRAAANQVVPQAVISPQQDLDSRREAMEWGMANQAQLTRQQLLAIATELEGQ